MTRPDERYEVRPFPKIRRAYVDVLREGHRRHIIHGLVEVDVTEARAAIRQRAAAGEPPLSFTTFVVACVGQAVDADRMLHAHRWGRRKLVLFENVDVNLQLEQTEPDGTRIVQSRIVRDTNHRSVEDISAEIRQARSSGTPADRRRLRGTLAFHVRPPPIRNAYLAGERPRSGPTPSPDREARLLRSPPRRRPVAHNRFAGGVPSGDAIAGSGTAAIMDLRAPRAVLEPWGGGRLHGRPSGRFVCCQGGAPRWVGSARADAGACLIQVAGVWLPPHPRGG